MNRRELMKTAVIGAGDGYALRTHHAPSVKRRTVAGYYNSKTGFDELNKGGRVPSTFGCSHDTHA